MSARSASPSRTSLATVLRAAGLAGALALVGTAASAAAAGPAHRAAAVPCTATATGAHWSLKGQKGTAYTILGEGGASCSLGARWLVRLTTSHGSTSPKGWTCFATVAVGECQVPGGGVFEFFAKVRK